MAPSRLHRRRFIGGALTPFGAAALAACGTPTGRSGWPTAGPSTVLRSSTLIANPSKDEWPERFHRAAPVVQEAYRFALAHPEVLQYMPCYCGCINDGHTSNKDCFIIEARADGSFMLEPMSFG